MSEMTTDDLKSQVHAIARALRHGGRFYAVVLDKEPPCIAVDIEGMALRLVVTREEWKDV